MTLYKKNNCPMWKKLESVMIEKGVAYDKVFLESGDEKTKEFMEKGFTSVPLLQKDDGEILTFIKAIQYIKNL